MSKLTGILKRTLTKVPLVIMSASFFVTMGALVAYSAIDSNIKEDFKKDPIVVEMKKEELNDLTLKLQEGEISNEAFEKRYDYMNTIEYVDDLLEKPELEAQEAYLKSKSAPFLTIAFIGTGTFILSAAVQVCFNRKLDEIAREGRRESGAPRIVYDYVAHEK